MTEEFEIFKKNCIIFYFDNCRFMGSEILTGEPATIIWPKLQSPE